MSYRLHSFQQQETATLFAFSEIGFQLLDWPRNIFTFYQIMFSWDDLPLEGLVKWEYTTVTENFKLDENCDSYLAYTSPKQGKL